jgi:hypothetical protein
VPVRRARYGEDHTVAGLLGDCLWGWGAYVTKNDGLDGMVMLIGIDG